MEYGRESYLRQLISRKHSRLIKIVSGIRRCGKSYLLNILFKKHLLETYLKDIVERNRLQNFEALEELVDMLASGIGGLTNAAKLERRFKSEKGITLSAPTIRQYLDFMMDAFLVQKVARYDIKGKRYINTPCKYYFTDIGLRNARINFRQPDMPHIMENIIYNELTIRGFCVDVGEVKILTPEREQKSVEVDFVVNRGSNRYYIQSAWAMPSEEKRRQEIRPLQRINDDFRKIVIVNDMMPSHQTEEGITIISLYDFLLNTEQMQRLFRF